MANTLV